jgi:hydroxypyruvate reductase
LPASDLAALKRLAAQAFRAAVRRADPGLALTDCIGRTGLPRPQPGGHTIVIAIGKAAPAMVRSFAQQVTGSRVLICVTHRENDESVTGTEIFRAGHPVPDEVGAHAARRVQEVLSSATAKDVVIALISGGGSALLPAPPPGVTLEDKQALNRLLLKSGLNINAMNAVRQHVSLLKGGGFLRLAAPAPVTGYILSDVIGNDLRAISSGPTVAPIAHRAEVLELLKRKRLCDALPESIAYHLRRPANAATLPTATNHLIGGNRESLEAAAAPLSRCVTVTCVDEPLVGDVNEAASTIHAALRKAHSSPAPQAIIWGGETTVNVRGGGMGGRNQELALRLACLMDATPFDRPWVFLSAGTDGRDGPTDAAGGLVDQGTIPRIRAAGSDPATLLNRNDSNAALRISGDLFITGATGTNVADIQVLLLGPA